MVNVHRRLQKLEALLTDGSGLRSQSPEWLEHCMRRLNRILSGEEAGTPGCIPLDVWDAIGDAGGAQDVEQLTAIGAAAGVRG